jgi:hypothetical protein
MANPEQLPAAKEETIFDTCRPWGDVTIQEMKHMELLGEMARLEMARRARLIR